jgi:predicted dehydrogenase
VADRRALGVGVVGFGWMGQAHTRAYLRVLHHFPDVPVRPVLVAVADPEPSRAADAREQYDFVRSTERWSEVVEDPEVEVVSVTAPNFLHRDIGAAVAAAGKHLWIEKPVGLTAADAEAVAAAVAGTGVQSAVGFNYRYAPAVAMARELIGRGDLGTVTHARVRLFSDYAAHPDGALSWRFERARGGSGVLGDLASHGVDLIRHLIGEIAAVVADTATFIPQRPQSSGAGSHFALATGGELGPVENEDFVSCLMRLAGGARVTLEASRVSVAEQCDYGVEVHGTNGMVAWDFRRMGELLLGVGDQPQNQSVTTVYVGPDHGDLGAFQPGAGIAMSFDDLKVIEAAHFLRSVAGLPGKAPSATIADAVASARVLDAMLESVRTGRWTVVSAGNVDDRG